MAQRLEVSEAAPTSKVFGHARRVHRPLRMSDPWANSNITIPADRMARRIGAATKVSFFGDQVRCGHGMTEYMAACCGLARLPRKPWEIPAGE